MRFLPTAIHGMMDYLMGIALIAAPFLFRFPEGAARWVPVVLGAGAIAYSLLTDYELGVVGVFSMPAHLGMDTMSGLLLAASPWLFGFASAMWMPHLILGLVEVGAALTTQTVPGHGPGRSRSTPLA
ncbi:SPW repeat domain-containing protein [Tundrisphaera sp. TA3]|uniref:SPW repeat domain-containing protein n=1 Tax=Tundrisphaera sp. TA3 TaxID=3435775 RepID=UPI003EB762D5